MKIKHNYIGIIIVIICGMLLRLTIYCGGLTNQYLRADDFGPLVYPAFLAGFDFSSFTKGLSNYYGYGYYWIFFPLFKLNISFDSILWGILLFNAALQIFTMLMIYNSCIKDLEIDNKLIAGLIALSAFWFCGDTPLEKRFWYRTDNELPLFLIVWMVFFLLVKLFKTNEAYKRKLFSAILGFVHAYAFSVHERSLILLLSMIIICCISALLLRKMYISVHFFLLTFVPFYIVHTYIKKSIIYHFFQSDNQIANVTAIKETGLIDYLKYANVIKGIFLAAYNNLFVANIKSYGMILILVIMITLIAFMKNSQKIRFLFPALYFLISIIIVIGGLSTKSVTYYVGGISPENILKIKGFSYPRYYYCFLGPIFVSALSQYYHFENTFCNRKYVLGICGSVLLLIIKIYYAYIYPLINKNERVISYSISLPYTDDSSHSIDFSLSVLLMITITVLFLCGYYYSKQKTALIILTCSVILFTRTKYIIGNIDSLHEYGIEYQSGSEIIKFLSVRKISREIGTVYLDLSKADEFRAMRYLLQLSERDLSFEIINDASELTLAPSDIVISNMFSVDYSQMFSDSIDIDNCVILYNP